MGRGNIRGKRETAATAAAKGEEDVNDYTTTVGFPKEYGEGFQRMFFWDRNN